MEEFNPFVARRYEGPIRCMTDFAKAVVICLTYVCITESEIPALTERPLGERGKGEEGIKDFSGVCSFRHDDFKLHIILSKFA